MVKGSNVSVDFSQLTLSNQMKFNHYMCFLTF